MQEWHAASALVIVVQICLLLLEFLLVMYLPAYYVESDAGLYESVRANRLAAEFAGPVTIRTLAVDTCHGEVRNQHTDPLGEFSVCPIIEVDTYRVR